jgi:hypothetical protein
LIQAIKNIFQALGDVLGSIRDAFRDIFPAKTGKQLADLTKQFRDFTERLKPSPETLENLKRTFRGFFAILSIGRQIVMGIFTVFGRLLGVLDGVGSGFLNFTGNIGDFLYSIDQALKKGDRLNKFFEGLGDVLAAPLEMLIEFKDALLDLFSGFSPGGFSAQIDNMTQSMTPLQRVLEAVSDAWDRFRSNIGDADILASAFESIGQAFQGLGPAINSAIQSMNFEAILAVIRTGLFAGLVLMFKRFFGRGSFLEQVSQGFGQGILGNISGSFDALQGSMVAMQNNIKAKTLKEIAIAIALLSLSVVALSLVDPKKLTGALSAMAVGFGQLLAAMAILEKMSTTTGFIKLPIIAAGLILLAGAINLLTISVVALSLLSWDQLLKGLTGVGVLLGILSVAAGPLSKNSVGLVLAGAGITALAVGLNILAIAVAQFAKMSMTELGKGMGSIAAGLVIIAGAMKLMPLNMAITGAGLIIVAAGLRLLANVVSTFGNMNWTTIGKGMIGIAGALVIIAGAMRLMPLNLPITAAGLVLVSLAMGKIASAIEDMGGLSIEQIAKGLGTLAGSLIVLAGGLALMQGSIGGAIALGIAASGLALLVPVLIVLGKQKWEHIIRGIISLGAAIAVLGVGAALLAPVIPAMLGLGAALLLIGAGLALAGTGIALIGVGLSAIAVSGSAASAVLGEAFTQLVEGLIKNAKLLIIGLLEVVRAFAASAPKFVDAVVKIVASVIDALIRLTPKFVELANVWIPAMIGILQKNQDQLIKAGFDLLIALLKGLRDNIREIVRLATDIIVNFLNGIARNIGRIVTAGTNILIALLRGIANNLARVATAALSIITRFLSAIANNLGRIATAGLSILTKLLTAISNNLSRVIKVGTDVIVKFIQGIGNAGPRIITAGTNAIIKLIQALSKNSVKLADAGAQAIIDFLNGIADVIEKREPEMIAAGVRIGIAIVKGFVKGLRDGIGEVGKAATDLVNSAKKKLKFWDSPPEAFGENLGKALVSGLAAGMIASKDAEKAATGIVQGVIGVFNTLFQIASPSKIMRQIGVFVGQGFAEGLRGSQEDIRSAFAELNQMLTEAMATARQTIAQEEDKLRELRKAKKPDAEAIAAAQKTIAQNEALLARSRAGHIALTKALRDEKAELIKLANDYAKVSEKLEAARQVLEDAIRTRDEATQGYKDQYSTLPEISMVDAEGNPISPEQALANYQAALANQAAAVQAYHSTLEKLRALGLDDATYQKLLDEGVGGQQFADALLAGGQTAVDSINQLDSNLMAQSTILAQNAARNLYQAGVDSARGIVRGLESQQSAIRKAMEKIATAMIRAIKKKLKIKSPSEVFAEVGQQSMEGMAEGFAGSVSTVEKAVDEAARQALEAMKSSMIGVSDIVSNELNPNPTITPILDLTLIRKQAQELNDLSNVVPITTASSYDQASAIAAAERARFDAEETARGVSGITFEQNNYSPKALDEVEIYRRTRNQISQIKIALEQT